MMALPPVFVTDVHEILIAIEEVRVSSVLVMIQSDER